MIPAKSIRFARMAQDARQQVFASKRRITCPRTKRRITEKSCAECRAAAYLVPALAEVCGKCSKNEKEAS